VDDPQPTSIKTVTLPAHASAAISPQVDNEILDPRFTELGRGLVQKGADVRIAKGTDGHDGDGVLWQDL
jgi:hypothetical protein